MSKKKTTLVLLMTAGTMMLSGCAQLQKQNTQWVPQASDAISIDTSGKITQIVEDVLDANYYSAAELEGMIQSEVSSYNTKNGTDSIVIQEFNTENKKVHLVIDYASAKDYAEFNNTELYSGSMINAQLAGYLFDTTFKKVSGGSIKKENVDSSEIIREMDKNVLILQAPMEVKVSGDVLYISSNSEMYGPEDVNATGEKHEEVEKDLILPSNAVYHFNVHDHTVEEEYAANRVYIIYGDD